MTTLNEADAADRRTVGFAERIKAGTDAAHRETEQSRFVGALLAGELTSDGYAELLAQTYLVYRELEDAGRTHTGNPVASPFLHDELLRVPSLEADLEFLRGSSWRETVSALPATTRYVERLREVAYEWPAGFVAHHYIRYMGDLSGGQIIRRMLERAYGYTTDGLQFYIFDDIPKPKVFKDTYRAKLDAAPLTPEDQQRVIDEVNFAYRLNGDLFAALEADIDRYLAR
ncbi:biliverdin-producing heme oxygenase [Rhodococcus opacus]|uniref:Biliverdin-producing heme oxygenase n=1 Tax=Rhodococcus opacus TaxID=37919 RepID=A0AAX3Y9U8_RHOOP|nr:MULTISPECIES: biliverdin-producing heme oxygenase [Rhodococcus]NHU48260.1 biliverdin-producing heme oxygenase [Rhodococcus sp. A14]MBA8964404.1 heme oxygenase [Rhodococcus opacus]MBP2207633.1 heme oxygenase [Rhodococcus opacus]MCZ4589348.1 biliverdin-producing heme oxygenase [Rhodococcus opacus]MDI9939487.1 biliverdin-producing heme oxygenase [Rhodococcus sp. IEGM 1351]